MPVPHPTPTTDTDASTTEPVAIGWLALTVPFAIVFVAALVLGSRSPGQLAATSALLVVPLAILALRKRTHHSVAERQSP